MKKTIFYVILINLMLLPIIVYADLYKYTQDSGTIVITSDSNKIPAKYKDNIVVIKDEANPSPDLPANPSPYKPSENSNIMDKLTNGITDLFKKNVHNNEHEGMPNIEELKDIKPIDNSGAGSKDLNKTIYLIGFSFIGSIISIFVVRLLIPKQPMRTIVTIIVVLLINIISFSSYIGPTLQKGSNLSKDMDKIKNNMEQRPNVVEKSMQ
jgi:hypothetical protein